MSSTLQEPLKFGHYIYIIPECFLDRVFDGVPILPPGDPHLLPPLLPGVGAHLHRDISAQSPGWIEFTTLPLRCEDNILNQFLKRFLRSRFFWAYLKKIHTYSEIIKQYMYIEIN